ncbi:tRNA preQ1(34) S-adenosylmethionine ribosyltransferase-isomerase QueA [Sphingomonas sp. LHG3406-1]|uniref:tRNA preQ1(34) S-adenosylmethionine ribosyltransferase-isomerase QueA n=1 Tax=Sphingomonas sp. LHG3406-1 TaxID=2804617 RepID=UPI002617A39F|nr:tRNA preQ1(34) S-adenosylmethionine ribosyltransferase-isomerase QueA [Sphingomonas sp. LHG3406-1]
MKVDLFDFTLPEGNIALRPARPRDSARMLLVDGDLLDDRGVRDLPKLLSPGDVLVFNDTKVIPAQLEGRVRAFVDGPHSGPGARIGATLHKRHDLRAWWAFVRNARRVKVGETVTFGGGVEAVCEEKGADGALLLRFLGDEAVELLLTRAGTMPLPPYIASKRPIDEDDAEDYQTMFAAREGAVAAPTASLHFTPRLIAEVDAARIARETLTLHVGAGTFLPIKADDTAEHKMHAEWGRIDAATAERLNAVRARGGRIIAVGTTVLRLLESAAADDGTIRPFEGDTDIFITPGYQWKAVGGLMTNFHLPKSTLFMLVSALMGIDTMRRAYAHAIASGYRFYSYGDSSLLLPAR